MIVGPGPSSSHTIGPYRISKDFLEFVKDKCPISFDVKLFGSLALTGKGHFTDQIIIKALNPYPTKVEFITSLNNLVHPNTMEMIACLKDGTRITKRYFSIGGGTFCVENEEVKDEEVYPFSEYSQAIEYMKEHHYQDIYQMIEALEGKDILDYSKKMLEISFKTLEDSLKHNDILPGPLKLNSVSGKIIAETPRMTAMLNVQLP